MTTTRTPAQQTQDAINSNRLAKANKLAARLIIDPDIDITNPATYEDKTGTTRFKVARKANVRMNGGIGDWTWKFAVGVARRVGT